MTQTSPASAFGWRNAPRLFCIGRNYADHVSELGNQLAGDTAIVFMKPPSALVAPGETIELPANRGAVHYEAELVVEIGAGGCEIPARNSRAHIRALGLGLDLTLRDQQTALKSGGEPWERAKAFDASAPLGPMTPLTDTLDLSTIEFQLTIDGEIRQHGRTDHMLVGIEELIASLSRDWTLAPGDLIYTGTPAGVGPLTSGMHLTLSACSLPSAEWLVA
ncbi:fumarylacetoacetate hydrolase family protein [Salinisphaera sp. USBA-960]|uniref:fumarylacetoacetate hydrolase family protein n=1 Tax=Salinisphaera orenii TaxID=856731 RepID=UPI000DBE07AD|nr:fumarylacetoacetate hydrolase family protein [Salifodinibacter halophilus]NNC26634.1 fumarylacetoacetate hydrolase family protein [Salifodinibacter halophilus]